MIRAFGLGLCVVVAAFVARTTRAPSAMSSAARAFAASLSVEQRAKACYAVADDERFDWHFIPRERHGIALAELNAEQRELVARLLRESLSERGAQQVEQVRVLEGVLRASEGDWRDPDKYFVTLFGDATALGAEAPWGWRYEGHHVALNFASADDAHFATTPSFLGTNPARVVGGAHDGLRMLGAEEDLARELMASLDDARRAKALVSTKTPGDITAIPGRDENVEATGLALADLDAAQGLLFWRLLDRHVERLHPTLAAVEKERMRALSAKELVFAWCGSTVPGEPHYYRIRGPRFAIEFDDSRAGVNHAHTVWRDFERDFGRDLLREHLAGERARR